LRPGSEQYQRFYAQHPEYEEYDTARRKLGGPVGKPGLIDKPHEKPPLPTTSVTMIFFWFLWPSMPAWAKWDVSDI
jgi:hypothetical protein